MGSRALVCRITSECAVLTATLNCNNWKIERACWFGELEASKVVGFNIILMKANKEEGTLFSWHLFPNDPSNEELCFNISVLTTLAAFDKYKASYKMPYIPPGPSKRVGTPLWRLPRLQPPLGQI